MRREEHGWLSQGFGLGETICNSYGADVCVYFQGQSFLENKLVKDELK